MGSPTRWYRGVRAQKDSAIGGEWRNVSALGKEEDPNRGHKNNRIVHCTRQVFFALHHISLSMT